MLEDEQNSYFFWIYVYNFNFDDSVFMCKLVVCIVEGFEEDCLMIEVQQDEVNCSLGDMMIFIFVDKGFVLGCWIIEERIVVEQVVF